MKKLQPTVLASLFVASLLVSVAAARQNKPAEPDNLALEILYYKDLPPAYQRISEANSAAKGSWFARFRRIASWTPSGDSLPVKAVKIVSRKEGDSVQVSVSVFLGVRFHEKEEPVADYLMTENQKVRVEGLTRFGVEPFEVGVVRVTPSSEIIPFVANKTASVEVVGIQPNKSVLPSYKVSLRNLSSKKIIALEIDVLVNGQERLSRLLHEPEGRPVVDARAVFETNVAGANNAMMTRYGYAPDSPRNQSVVITSVVFEDGTYEGETRPAAQFMAFTVGRKIRLMQVADLFQRSIEVADVTTRGELERLKAEVSSLKDDVNVSVVDEMLKDFVDSDQDARPRLKQSIETTLHAVKKSVLDEIEAFEREHKAQFDAKAYRAWLTATAQRYRQWLSRLGFVG